MVKLRRVVEEKELAKLDISNQSEKEEFIKALKSEEVGFTQGSFYSMARKDRPLFTGDYDSIWGKIIDWFKKNLMNNISHIIFNQFEDDKIEKTKTAVLKQRYNDLESLLAKGKNIDFYFYITNHNLRKDYYIEGFNINFPLKLEVKVKDDTLSFSYAFKNSDYHENKTDYSHYESHREVVEKITDGYLQKFGRDLDSVLSKCSSEWKSKLQEKLDYISTSIQNKVREDFNYVARWYMKDGDDQFTEIEGPKDLAIDSNEFQKSLGDIGNEILTEYAKIDRWPHWGREYECESNWELTIIVDNLEGKEVAFYYGIHVEGTDDRQGDEDRNGSVELDLNTDSLGYNITKGKFDEEELERIENFIYSLHVEEYIDGHYSTDEIY